MKFILLALALVCCGGCASGPRFEPMTSIPADKAVVYVYRPKQVIGWGGLFPVNSPWIVCPNGEKCVDLRQGGYCVFEMSPGTNIFTSSLVSPSALLDVIHNHEELCRTNFEAAKTYYLKFSVGATRAKLKLVEPETAVAELEHLKLENQ